MAGNIVLWFRLKVRINPGAAEQKSGPTISGIFDRSLYFLTIFHLSMHTNQRSAKKNFSDKR
jgi:hypothetical protein